MIEIAVEKVTETRDFDEESQRTKVSSSVQPLSCDWYPFLILIVQEIVETWRRNEDDSEGSECHSN